MTDIYSCAVSFPGLDSPVQECTVRFIGDAELLVKLPQDFDDDSIAVIADLAKTADKAFDVTVAQPDQSAVVFGRCVLAGHEEMPAGGEFPGAFVYAFPSKTHAFTFRRIS